MSTWLIALLILVVVAAVVYGFVATVILGPTGWARRRNAEKGPSAESDGEPREVF